MALKGTTRIELTNVKTGEVEVIEKHNLVTNAVAMAMTENPLGVFYKNNGWISKNMLPICPNAIGGILCFEDAIEESVDQLYPPVGNHLVACSSNNVNPGVSTIRGSMSQTESGPLEDWTGYRFVFDFGTGQGNGTISALGLTSKWGGIAGMGDTTDGSSWIQKVEEYRSNAWGGANEDMYAWRHLKSLDIEKNLGIAVYFDSNGNIRVAKMPMQLRNLSLVHPSAEEPLMHPNWNRVEYHTVVLSDAIANLTSSSGSAKYRLAYIHDGGDGNWWVFANAGNRSGNATVYWAKISKEDLSVEEGSFVSAAALSPCGEFCGFGYNNYSKYIYDKSYSAMANGKLYVMNYNKDGIYELDLPSGIPLRLITSPYSMVRRSGYGYPELYLRNVAGFVWNSGCIIGGDDVIYRDGYTSDGWDNNLVFDGVYALNTTYGKGGVDVSIMTVALFTPYLATINNLPAPVQKTADKTMKITYILREE